MLKLAHDVDRSKKKKFNSEWEEGVWLGHARSSNEIIIGTGEGVVRAYAIQRQDDENRWQGDGIKGMKGTPSQPDPGKPGLNIPVRVRSDPIVGEPQGEQMEDTEAKTRRERITHKTLDKYGYTEGCDGCVYKGAGLKEPRNHSEACRKRIEGLRRNDRDQDRPHHGEQVQPPDVEEGT